MKTNLCVFCVLNNYGQLVSKAICEKLDMFYCNAEDMIDFELGDIEHIFSVLGDKSAKKYVRENEAKVIKRVSSFENTLINITPKTLFGNRNFDRVAKTSYVIYLQMSPKHISSFAEQTKDVVDEKLLELTFCEQDKLYVQKSDIVVNCTNLKVKKATKKVFSDLNTFFKKQKKEKIKNGEKND